MKSIINNTRDLLKSISNIENEINGINGSIVKLKSAKATITQPTDNQLLTWNEDLSMVEDSLWQLPAADGAANEIMYTDGAGNLDWIAPGAAAVAGADTQVQYNAAGVMAAEAAFTYNYNTNTLTADHYQATIDFTPDAADGASLGTAALEFSDLYLADSSVIYFGDDQDVTLTHVADTGLQLNLGLGIGIAPNATTILKLYRNDASTTAMAEIEQDSTGDASLLFQLSGGQAYTIGIDNSDADVLKISPESPLTNTDYLSMNSSGFIGLGIAPSSDDLFLAYYAPTNISNANLFSCQYYPVCTVNGLFVYYGFNFNCKQTVNAGVTNSGFYSGTNTVSYKNGAGTLSWLLGNQIDYGMYTDGAGIVTNAIGAYYRLHCNGGTINTAYDIYIDTAGLIGGTVNNEWVIYSLHDAPSRLINDLQIDDDTYGIVFGDGQDARIYYNGANLVFDSQLVGAGNFIFNNGYLRTDTSRYRRYYHLPLASFDPGASGATWTSATGDHLAGWQINAVGEVLEFSTDVHADWDGASDLTVEIRFQLLDAGNPGDTVDLRLVSYYMGDGEVATKTQSDEVATVTDGTQYKMYTVTFTIDYDALGNNVDAGDIISFELNLETDTSEIDNVLIVGGSFFYNTTHTGIESGDT